MCVYFNYQSCLGKGWVTLPLCIENETHRKNRLHIAHGGFHVQIDLFQSSPEVSSALTQIETLNFRMKRFIGPVEWLQTPSCEKSTFLSNDASATNTVETETRMWRC